MNYIISESQKNTVSKNFISILKTKDMYDTLGMFKIPAQFLDKVLGKNVLNFVDCVDYNYFYFYYFFRTDLIKKSYEDEFYKIQVGISSHDMTTDFSITEKSTNNSMTGYATPYYEGECNLPIDIEYFQPNSDQLNEFGLSLFFEKTLPKKFDSFSSMFEFFSVYYFKFLINACRPLFIEYRDQYED